MEKLKPCPFCGSAATMSFEIRNEDDSTIGVAYAECFVCDARTGEERTEPFYNGELLFSEILGASSKAAAHWNRRANDLTEREN